jgi:ATP-dependent NAD(P)H-hydrate dehydratase
MVHPLMRQSPTSSGEPSITSNNSKNVELDPERVSAEIIEMLPRLHVLVVGPGLGRDSLMHATVARVIKAARKGKMPVVIDADALQIVQNDPEIVRGYEGAILTPNVVEFKRLCDALGIKDEAAGSKSETEKVETLARALGGVTIVQKGGKDYISNGVTTLADDLEGGKKRSGGQGDTLTGSIATFLGWRNAYLDGLWDVGKEKLDAKEMIGLAAFGGSAITRVRPANPQNPRRLNYTNKTYRSVRDLLSSKRAGVYRRVT